MNMLAIEAAQPGRVYHWSIAQLMTRESSDCRAPDDWDRVLYNKRLDPHYEDVKESLDVNGFVRPLQGRLQYNWRTDTFTEVQLGDGHHRIAAAIDLGLEAVPILIHETTIIDADSGEWCANKPIPTEPFMETWTWPEDMEPEGSCCGDPSCPVCW